MLEWHANTCMNAVRVCRVTAMPAFLPISQPKSVQRVFCKRCQRIESLAALECKCTSPDNLCRPVLTRPPPPLHLCICAAPASYRARTHCTASLANEPFTKTVCWMRCAPWRANAAALPMQAGLCCPGPFCIPTSWLEPQPCLLGRASTGRAHMMRRSSSVPGNHSFRPAMPRTPNASCGVCCCQASDVPSTTAPIHRLHVSVTRLQST